jgi:DNA-binding NarL/FixJ family response regulator
MNDSKTPPASAGSKRIVILDDHPIMRLGLEQLISAEPGLAVCGQAGTTAEALELVRQLKPDLLLSDLSLPDKHGLEFIKDMQAMFPDCSILVLSMHDESLYAERVLRAGAGGYLMKKSAAEHLIKAIQRVLAGGIYLSEAMAETMLELLRPQRRSAAGISPIERLTDRELEVFQLIGTGISSRQIAEKLNISLRTVDAHRSHIKDKLQLGDGNALVHLAISWVESQG